jgi:hypothetical protein
MLSRAYLSILAAATAFGRQMPGNQRAAWPTLALKNILVSP